MNIVLLTADLQVHSRVDAVATDLAASVQSAANSDAAVEASRRTPADVVIIDLAVPVLDVGGLVAELKSVRSARPKIIAFGPHVHEEKLKAARDAGCDEVFSRGQFFGQLDTILSRSAAP